MKGNRIVAGIVGLAVCVILVGSLLVPVISEAQDDQEVVYNNIVGDSNYSKIVDDDLDGVDMVIVWDPATDVLTVDGTAIFFGNYNNVLFVSDQGMVRFNGASETSSMYIGGQSGSGVTLTGTVTATVASGVITVACGVDSYTITPIEWLFVPDNGGNYRSYHSGPTETQYVNSIDDIYFCDLGAQPIGLYSGHGGSCTLWDMAGDPSYDMTYTIQRVQGYTDLYEFTPSSYAVSTEGTNLVPYYLMVPVEITAHTDVNSSIIGLLGAIPVVVIAAIIIYVVRPVLRGRGD